MLRNSSGTKYLIPTALNAAIVIVQLLLLVGSFLLAAHTHNMWALVGLAFCFAVLMNSVYAVVHEAEHAILFPNRRVNEIVGIVMALFFPAPFHLLRQGHIGHHMRNRSDDEAFDLYFEGDNVIWKWMVWLGILTGMYYLLVVFSNLVAIVAPFVLDRRRFRVNEVVTVDRASAAFLDSLNPECLRAIRFEAIAAVVLHTLIIVVLGVPIVNYLVLYAAFGFMWSAMQYVHHYDTERHVTRGARNLWLFKPIDLIWLNHNWHRAHHEHPTIPWIHLGNLANETEIEEANSGKSVERRGFLPWAYLKMWRGPKRTDQHVENKYAGQIIK